MSVIVRPMEERDLQEADRINRIAFGTFFGLPDPARFRGDGEAVRGRFRTDPDASILRVRSAPSATTASGTL